MIETPVYSRNADPDEHRVRRDACLPAEEIVRLRRIETAARNLDSAMLRHKNELLSTCSSCGWDWAWDDLANALAEMPNESIDAHDPSAEQPFPLTKET